MPLAPGQRVGAYDILAPLGAGGMGEVYRARDSRLDRDVALKLLPAELAGQPDRLARFEREAKTVAGLNHPNIVVLHSIEESDGVRFITMELVEGEPLDRLVVPGGVGPRRVLDLALGIANALTAAHARGIVHRDLKPSNVIVTRDGLVKVLDFGLAKLASAGGVPAGLDATRTMTSGTPISSVGQIVGTVPYMAPEQLRGEPVDARADLFSLGILIYELASGRRPFGGATSADVTSSILRDAPPSLAQLRADLPPDLVRVAERLLEKEPDRRIQTAQDVRTELDRARRALGDRAGEGAKPRATPKSEDVPSIAILPFVNMSRDEENEYFSDGLAEELLNVLAKIRGLRVAARSSAFSFKGKNASVEEIGQALRVATVLEGSVRKAGNRVRIGVQLVKVEDGYHLWSETYDRTLDDIFAVQDDIAQAVVKELRTTLLGEEPDSAASGDAKAEVAEAARGRGEGGEAHQLLLRGRFLLDRFNHDDVVQGILYLRQAVALDPTYALAWAALGRALMMASGYNWVPIEDGYREAREAGQRALAIEPNLAEGHMVLAGVAMSWDWDWPAALESSRRAVELAPGSAEVLRAAANVMRDNGPLDQGIQLAERAVAIDPLNPGAHATLGMLYRTADRPDDACRAYDRSFELAPGRAIGHHVYALVLMLQGRLDDARREALAEPERWAQLTALSALDWLAGRREDSDRQLQALTRDYGVSSGYQIAGVHAIRGELDEAFRWLELARAARDPGLSTIRREPVFRRMHEDPRWPEFLRSMGLTPAS